MSSVEVGETVSSNKKGHHPIADGCPFFWVKMKPDVIREVPKFESKFWCRVENIEIFRSNQNEIMKDNRPPCLMN